MSLLITLIGVAAILTFAMFTSRQSMLGFPSGIFWFLAGAKAYTMSTTPWVSIEFYIAIACMLGMTVFCIYGAYGLREKRDAGTDRDEYVDESEDSTQYYGEGGQQTEPSEDDGHQREPRQQSARHPMTRRDQLRERAKNRRPHTQKELNEW